MSRLRVPTVNQQETMRFRRVKEVPKYYDQEKGERDPEGIEGAGYF